MLPCGLQANLFCSTSLCPWHEQLLPVHVQTSVKVCGLPAAISFLLLDEAML